MNRTRPYSRHIYPDAIPASTACGQVLRHAFAERNSSSLQKSSTFDDPMLLYAADCCRYAHLQGGETSMAPGITGRSD